MLGPGDVPIHDNDVRLAFFKEVGQREDFQACLEHDFVGANARTRRIDNRRALEVTAESGKQPATRLATTMLLYSFGGLARGAGDHGDPLPPGIGEPDLFGATLGPDLDTTTIQACLKELKEQCLYLHFDGVRYCFKKDPNVTLLVEQEAEAVARHENLVQARIRRMIEERLAGQQAIVWPRKPGDVPDGEPRFLIAYLPLGFAAKSPAEQRSDALALFEQSGNRPRVFRNGLGLGVPAAGQVEALRRGVRYLLAVERVQQKWREHNLTGGQKGQLRERKATERAAVESALLKLYAEVWLPASGDRVLTLETISLGGRPLQTTLDEEKRALIHQRLIELLMTIQQRVFGTVAPGKIVELFKIGEEGASQTGIATDTVRAGFFEFLGFPRLLSAQAVRKAIARGVETGLFGYAIGRPKLGEDGSYQIDRQRISFERTVADDEIDLDSGFLIVPTALPVNPVTASGQTPDDGGDSSTSAEDGSTGQAETATESDEPQETGSRTVALSFVADRKNVYGAWNALANLADLTGAVSITATATAAVGYDRAKLENGVLEPLRELGLIEEDEE